MAANAAALAWAWIAPAAAAVAPDDSAVRPQNSQTASPQPPARARARDRYLTDLSQVKNATLESEPVFFERLERLKKLEEVRFEATYAAQKLRVVRLRLSPPELDPLDQAEQSLVRASEPVDEARNLAAAAVRLIREFHEGGSPWAIEVARGRGDAAAYLSHSRRYIKAAERKLNNVALHVATSHRRIEQATGTVTQSLDKTREDDPHRAKLLDASRTVEATSAALVRSGEQVIALVEQLEKIRRLHLPDCATDTPDPNSDTAAAVLALNDCQGSIAILQKSMPAIQLLENAAASFHDLSQSLLDSETKRRQAVALLEQADAILNPNHDRIRKLAVEAIELLDRSDTQLSTLRRTLTADVPGELKECSHCGRTTIRTRKVIDPACLCPRANAEMRDVEDLIKQVRGMAEEMSRLLNIDPAGEDRLQRPTPHSLAANELRGSKGILDQLAVALERSHEFQTGKFDPFPGEISLPSTHEPPVRAFPPMVATYAARTSWHYPLYFEDISAERYGLHHGCFQPIVSYSKFIADLAFLPYNFCLDHPKDVIYDLGMYRPGDCAPHLIYLPRPDWKAAVFQAAVWTGIMYTP